MQTVSDDAEREHRQSDHHSGKDEQMAAVNQNSRESSIILPTKEWVPECLNPESSFLLPREIAL